PTPFLFSSTRDHRDLHSFPTRRSSDLTCPPASVVGSATAVGPLLRAPLRGPVILAFSESELANLVIELRGAVPVTLVGKVRFAGDRKSTRLNSSHLVISYAVFCLKKKK